MPLTQAPTSMIAQDAGLARAHMGQDAAIPAGVVLPYAGSSAPAGWLLCHGQNVSRTVYAALFAAIGTTYGIGDGTTTFGLPDVRGRVIAGEDDMGGTNAQRLTFVSNGTTTNASAVVTGLSSTAGLAVGMRAFGSTLPAGVTIASIDSATQVTLSTGTGVTAGTVSLRFGIIDGIALGDAAGGHVHTLTAAQIPAHNHPLAAPFNTTTAGGAATFTAAANVNASGSGTTLNTSNNTGGGGAHSNLQPTIIMNKIIKT